MRVDERLDLVAKGAQLRAIVHQHLAPEQIECLNRIGALVNHVDARIAQVLLHSPFSNVAVAAKNLQRLRAGNPRVIGQEGFHDRRQQGDLIGRCFANLLVRMIQLAIDHQRDIRGEGTATLGIRARGQQHAAYVRMHEDAIGRLVRIFRAAQAASLHALTSVGDRILVRDFGQAKRLHTDTEARGVHHDEHGAQPAVRLADQPARGIIKVDLAGRVAMDAHFVFNRAAGDAVAFARIAAGIRQVLRHHK